MATRVSIRGLALEKGCSDLGMIFLLINSVMLLDRQAADVSEASQGRIKIPSAVHILMS